MLLLDFNFNYVIARSQQFPVLRKFRDSLCVRFHTWDLRDLRDELSDFRKMSHFTILLLFNWSITAHSRAVFSAKENLETAVRFDSWDLKDLRDELSDFGKCHIFVTNCYRVTVIKEGLGADKVLVRLCFKI